MEKGIELLKANGVHVDYLKIYDKISFKKIIYGFISNIKNKHPEINVKVASYENGLTIPKKGYESG